MKGIILAGGSGTRLQPITRTVCKQLLPVYDKPMIYYPLSVLMLAGIKDVLIISTPQDLPKFRELFGDGKQLGMNISYRIQPQPNGIAEAFIIGEDFIEKDNVCLILGDNIFFGQGLPGMLAESINKKRGATIFAYYVSDPDRYGVVEFDKKNKVLSIVEKPERPKSNYAVTGIYFYDKDIVGISKNMRPSKRGELEITDVNNRYLKKGKLSVKLMGRGFAWLDTGTSDSLLDASNYIATIERRQGLKIGCIEEIALKMGFIDRSSLKKIINGMSHNSYRKYLERIIL